MAFSTSVSSGWSSSSTGRLLLVGDVVVRPADEAGGLVELRLRGLVVVLRGDELHLRVRDGGLLLGERDLGLRPHLHEALDLRQVLVLVVERLLGDVDELLVRARREVRLPHVETMFSRVICSS